MNPYKEKVAKVTNKNNQKNPLAEGFKVKDIFIGVSRPNMVSQAMIRAMAKDPIVMPLGNPIGEITTDEALAAGAAIAVDGRDVNNALAYPALFRVPGRPCHGYYHAHEGGGRTEDSRSRP